MLHPDTQLVHVSEEVGFGVVATRRIPAGTITWVLDPLDQTLSPDRVAALPGDFAAPLERYSFALANGTRVLCWDHTRFVNHSCEPNCVSPCGELEIAVRDVEPGQQITNDYATLNPTESMHCHCGAARCRGTVRSSDLSSLAVGLDGRLDRVRHLVATVHQPLLHLVGDARRRWLYAAISTGFPSVETLASTNRSAPCA